MEEPTMQTKVYTAPVFKYKGYVDVNTLEVNVDMQEKKEVSSSGQEQVLNAD